MGEEGNKIIVMDRVKRFGEIDGEKKTIIHCGPRRPRLPDVLKNESPFHEAFLLRRGGIQKQVLQHEV